MKRMTSRKSHSWWWDSHINPKNSRWLFENLEQMDRLIKEMLKLIEEEGDTFAKKAEMYYQRRPKLLAHVEDFYRMYRALAERYDNVTGELRKNMPSDLQSQSSGNGSDFGTDSASPSFSPSSDQTPERKNHRPKQFRRAPGFEVFLGSAVSSDFSRKDSDESPSTSSSESDSDSEDGKVVDADDNTSGLSARIIQLEEELREVREKLKEYEKNFNGQCDHLMCMDEHQDQEDKMGHESEDKTVILEGEIRSLKEAMEVAAKKFDDEASLKNHAIEEYKAQLDEALNKLVQEKSILEINLAKNFSDLKLKTEQLAEEKSSLEIRILEQEQMIRKLKTSAESSESLLHENSLLEAKVCSLMNSENMQATKLHALEKCEACNASSKQITDLNQSLVEYKLKFDMLKSEEDDDRVSKLIDLENIHEANLQVLENRLRDLEAEKAEARNESAKLIAELNQCLDGYKLNVNMLTSEKDELNARVSHLVDLKNIHEPKMQALKDRVRELEAATIEARNESVKLIGQLNQSLDGYKLRDDMLTLEKDELSARVSNLTELRTIHEAKIQALENRIRELEAAKAEACSENMKGIDDLNQSLDRYKLKVEMLTSEKAEVDATVSKLFDSKSIHEAEIQALESRLGELEAAKTEACNESAKQIDELNQSLDRYKLKVDILTSEKDVVDAKVSKLINSKDAHDQALENRVRELEAAKAEACNESSRCIVELNQSLDSYKLKVDMLTSEKDQLNARVSKLMDDAICWDSNSRGIAEQLQHLNIEHANLIKEIEEARRVSSGLMNRVRELEREVERQRVLVLDGAEGKREAIRQLCFSLEHYRDRYQSLRQMLQRHNRRLAVKAT